MLPWNVQNVTYFIKATIVAYTNCHEKNVQRLNSESSKRSLGWSPTSNGKFPFPKNSGTFSNRRNCLSDPRKLVHNWNTLPTKNGLRLIFWPFAPKGKGSFSNHPFAVSFRCCISLTPIYQRFTHTFVPNWCAWTWRNFTMQDTFWWLFGPVG